MNGKRDFRDDGSISACARWVLAYILCVLVAVLWVLSLVFLPGEQP